MVLEVRRLAPLGARQRLHVLGPAPARFEHQAADRPAAQVQDLRPAVREGTDLVRSAEVQVLDRTGRRRCRRLPGTGFLVPCLQAGLRGDPSVTQVQHRGGQHPRAVRVAASLQVRRMAAVGGDDDLLQVVLHVPAAQLVEELADRGGPGDLVRVARLVALVHDGQLCVVRVQAAHGGSVALLDSATQRFDVEHRRSLHGAHQVPAFLSRAPSSA